MDKTTGDTLQKPMIFNDPIRTIKDSSVKIADEITKTAKNTVDFYTSKTVVIVGLIFTIILCVFVAYGLYWVISNSIFNQSKIIIQGTKVPVLCNVQNQFSITEFNKTGNGKRRSYTFWIYINDMNKYTGSYKKVFSIGDKGDIRRSSPYIFLDKTENKMFVRFAAVTNDTFDEELSSVQNLSQTQLSKFMVQGIEIPYIPIQRWVHIAIVVNENSNGGTIVGYVDGDISKIVTTGEINSTNNVIKINNLDLDKMGNLHVGGSFDSLDGPGFSGLISKVTLFNYDLNDKDVYEDYNRGPLNGLLSSLGLANYGVRSPIYKIV